MITANEPRNNSAINFGLGKTIIDGNKIIREISQSHKVTTADIGNFDELVIKKGTEISGPRETILTAKKIVVEAGSLIKNNVTLMAKEGLFAKGITADTLKVKGDNAKLIVEDSNVNKVLVEGDNARSVILDGSKVKLQSTKGDEAINEAYNSKVSHQKIEGDIVENYAEKSVLFTQEVVGDDVLNNVTASTIKSQNAVATYSARNLAEGKSVVRGKQFATVKEVGSADEGAINFSDNSKVKLQNAIGIKGVANNVAANRSTVTQQKANARYSTNEAYGSSDIEKQISKGYEANNYAGKDTKVMRQIANGTNNQNNADNFSLVDTQVSDELESNFHYTNGLVRRKIELPKVKNKKDKPKNNI